jgi:predicted nuclease of predicted toxin-antitoxin system
VKLLIDMNLPPAWVRVFEEQGWSSVHWSSVGDPRAPDATLLEWAKRNDYVVFTHDLDFGMVLALTQATGPSVIQARTQDVLPDAIGKLVVAAIHAHEDALTRGALITIDQATARARVLPILRTP